jgi:hypothetical protein
VEQLESRVVPSATITGTVFQALDVADPTNLKPNPGPPIKGVTVLLDHGSSMKTGSDGSYSFSGVAAGSHTVSIQLPLPKGYWGFSAQSLSDSLVIGPSQTAFPNLNFGLTPINQAIVQNLFERVLNRPADKATFDTLVQKLNGGGTVGGAFRDLFQSTEFQNLSQPVASLLAAFFPGQGVDPGLLRNSVQLENMGVTQDAAVLNILYSRKFVDQFGDLSKLTSPAFVTFLYQQLLGRAPTPKELNGWVTQLNSGALNRGQVTLGVIALPEFQARVGIGRAVTVSLAYLGVLGHEPDPSDLQFWSNQLKGGLTVAGLANKLTNSKEFQGLHGYDDTFLADVQAFQIPQAVDALSRLQLYNPADQAFDKGVTAGSITSTAANPTNVYFIAHGWAPGFTEDLLLHSTPGDPLKSWQTVEFPGGIGTPAPDPPWLYAGVNQVSAEGLAQAIVDADPNAQVIAFSWIDQSATPGSETLGPNSLAELLQAGRSESYTQLNGLRLAEGIEAALSASFFPGQGLIHILGHSHGSKVATVAALALQQAGVPVAQLTTFESPEGGPAPVIDTVQFPPLQIAGLGGAENFLWYYMQQMNLSRTPLVSGTRTPTPPTNGQFPTFIDNYYSQDGVGSALGGFTGLSSFGPGSNNLNSIVDVNLHPEDLYPLPTSLDDPDLAQKVLNTLFGSHDYPPPWYGQASLQGPGSQHNGLAWSPLLNADNAANLAQFYEQQQQDTIGKFVMTQFVLNTPGTPPNNRPSNLVYTPTAPTPLQYAQQYTVGSVGDTGSTLTLSVDPAHPEAVEAITFNPLAATTGKPGTGMDFQFQFSGISPGEQVELVVWIRGLTSLNVPAAMVNKGTFGYLSVPLFTMDGADAGTAAQRATISLDGFLSDAQDAPIVGPFNASQIPTVGFTLLAPPGSSATVTVSNLRQFNDGITV